MVKEIQASLVIKSFLVLRLLSWEPFNNNLWSNEKLRSKIFDAWPIIILGHEAALARPLMNDPISFRRKENINNRNNCSGYTWELLPWLERMTGPIKLRTLLLMVIQHGGETIYLFLFILVLFSTTVFFSVHDTWFHEVQWAIAILCELLGQL